jgi:hypothetical protein
MTVIEARTGLPEQTVSVKQEAVETDLLFPENVPGTQIRTVDLLATIAEVTSPNDFELRFFMCQRVVELLRDQGNSVVDISKETLEPTCPIPSEISGSLRILTPYELGVVMRSFWGSLFKGRF